MMKKSYSLKLEGKEWKDCLKESYNKKKKDVKIDGFRKGLVPYEVYTKKAGVESLYMDAMDMAVDKLYAKLLSDPETITPAATPSIDIKNITEEEVEVEFTLVSSPDVKIGKYKNLGIKKDKVEVKEEEIDHELGHIREQYAEVRNLDDKTPLENGMIAVIDFEGFKDGVAFKGGKGNDYNLELGSNTFIPGFEEALVGLKKGDKKDVNVTFPEDYQDEAMAGKDAVFSVKINSKIKSKKPEYNEEFIKAHSDYDNKKDYEASIKKELEEELKKNNTAETKQELWEQVMSGSKVKKYPKKQYKAEKAAGRDPPGRLPADGPV